MRAFLVLLLACSVVTGAVYEYGSDESASSPEVPDSSVSSSEEVIDSDQVEIIEGSGSGDEPVVSIQHINVLGILPGPGDIRKKRDLLSTLLRK